MPSERLIPTPAAPTVATFTILSEGEAVSRVHDVLSIIVHYEANRIPTATLIIRDGDAAAQTFEASNTDLFIPGKRIEVKAGYQGTEDTIFTGVVISQSVKIREQSSVLKVVAKDEAFKMTVGINNRYFRDQKDSDVIEDIIRQNGLQADVEATAPTHPEVVQYNSSDWDFMLTRAEMNSKICIVENGRLSIAEPDFSQAPAQALQYGATLLEFDAEIDARQQFRSVKSRAWGIASQELLESEEGSVNVPEAGNLSSGDLADVHGVNPFAQAHSGNLAEVELQAWTKARLLKSRLAKIRGRAKFQGLATIKPGTLVKLQGVGERFEGNVFVSAVRHEIGKGNWLTDAQFGLSPEWFVQKYKVTQPEAGGMLPPVSGLQVGVVTQLENDPLGEHRVMVRLPVISPEDEGTWARVATLDAGEERGSFFRPEIGDEVIVGFLNDDPRHPIIIGSCHSSAKPAPLEATDENHEKGFVTRSGMKWLFNDDKKNVLLETPDGNKILVSGEDQSIQLEDQNGNKITMDSSGITIESARDINLKASQGDINIEGINLKAKGNGTAEFSAGGTTTLKGGLVQIN
ncbi:MAG: type VI secretion system tip protein VgrG [Phaeodactylibacter sp.]|nr:type VI secretion system tip protein VgrG [Phaeodactylibacter sp.]MCB9049772.1 type VI secretion system tip protein VgrG [Lewinellaceae bacterium]